MSKESKNQSALSQIKTFIKTHLPHFHHAWHMKVDLHLFKIIFMGLALVIIIVGIVSFAATISNPEQKQTTGSRASERPTAFPIPQKTKVLQAYLSADGRSMYHRTCDIDYIADSKNISYTKEGISCNQLQKKDIFSDIFFTLSVPEQFRSYSIVALSDSLVSEAVLSENGQSIYFRNCPYTITNEDVNINRKSPQCTESSFQLQESYRSFDRFVYRGNDPQKYVRTVLVRTEDPTKTVSMDCKLNTSSLTPGACKPNSAEYTTVPKEYPIDPATIGITDPAFELGGYSVLLVGGSEIGDAKRAHLAYIGTKGDAIYYRFCPWNSAGYAETTCINTVQNVQNELALPSIQSFSRFEYYPTEQRGLPARPTIAKVSPTPQTIDEIQLSFLCVEGMHYARIQGPQNAEDIERVRMYYTTEQSEDDDVLIGEWGDEWTGETINLRAPNADGEGKGHTFEEGNEYYIVWNTANNPSSQSTDHVLVSNCGGGSDEPPKNEENMSISFSCQRDGSVEATVTGPTDSFSYADMYIRNGYGDHEVVASWDEKTWTGSDSFFSHDVKPHHRFADGETYYIIWQKQGENAIRASKHVTVSCDSSQPSGAYLPTRTPEPQRQ